MNAEPTYEELKARVQALEKRLAELQGRQTAGPENEPDFKQLFENAPVGIFQTTSTGAANYINRQMARMVAGSYPEEEVPLFTDLSRQLYADPARREEFLQIMAEKGEVQGFEYEAISLDGSRKWFSMNARVSRRFDDGTFAIDGFVSDITELKNTQLALQKSRQLLEETQQITRVGGWEYHPETGHMAWTNEAYQIYGVSRDQHDPSDIAKDLSFYAEDDRQVLQEAFSRALNEAIPYDLQLRLITGTGRTIRVRTTGKPEQAEDGRVVRVYGNIMDITDQKEAEEKHRQLAEQLQQAQKMEAVGRLAGGIAHDFNNLLSVIIGYSEILLAEIREDHSHHPPLQQIQNASTRARDLVRQMLAFSRKQVLEIRSIDINRVITGFESFIGRVIGEDIHLDLILSDTPVFVEADAAQLEQVLMNMVINARDAMPEGGRLTIETAAVNLDELADADKPIDAGGCHAVITVGDTGTGMDADTRSRAFEPFFTTKEKEKGTGLGLATCYGIIKQHGGDIRIDSQTGQGTRFRIYLPCPPGKQPEKVPAENPGEDRPAADPASILVIEDDPSVLNLTCSVLEKHGYRVKPAGDVHTAVTHAKNHPGPLHLVLTDVIMPEMKGPEVCREVARYHPEIKILYMSGYTDNIISGQVSTDQGAEFIQKPFSIRELGEKVRRVLEK